MEIFKKLVEQRHKKGMTQSQVAVEMGTTASAVARFESGGGKRKHSPSLRTVRLYANSLGLDFDINLKPL